MISRGTRQPQKGGILPTYIGDDASEAGARRRMGIPIQMNGSISSIIISPSRVQWMVIVTMIALLFIGARIALPQVFHTSSDLVTPPAKSDPTITMLVAEAGDDSVPPSPRSSSPSPIPPPLPSAPVDTPSPPSSVPPLRTIDQQNDARAAAVGGGGEDNAPSTPTRPLNIDTTPLSPSSSSPAPSDLAAPRPLARRAAAAPVSDSLDPEWIPEGPFPERSAEDEADVTATRLEAVRNAFIHAWSGYERYAFGHDELRPVTNKTNDSWGRWGVTLVDALDTMMIMGLNEQVARAKDHVAKLNFDVDYEVSFFETSIRYLGGLLSAYELSHDKIYLTKAAELGSRLASSFDSTKTGLPQSIINLRTKRSKNHSWNGGASILAEVGSVQLEYAYLAYHMNQSSYKEMNDKSRRVFTVLDKATKPFTGLYPVYVDPELGIFTGQSRISFGSLADSFYEYLLKLWVLSDKSDEDSLRMYNEAMVGFTSRIVHRRPLLNEQKEKISEWVFMGELMNDRAVLEQEHLTCFMPGLLALGGWHGLRHAQVLASRRQRSTAPTAAERVLTENAQLHISLAEELAATCAETYFQTYSGLGPESIQFDQIGSSSPWSRQQQQQDTRRNGRRPRTMGAIWEVQKPKYILRPETLESLFVLWRVTGDRKYREWGWHIFEALEINCRTPSSFSGLIHVDAKPNGRKGIEENWDNSMQSFYFAETLKYLYLLFSDNDVIPLDKYVFNTEAHPLGIIPFNN